MKKYLNNFTLSLIIFFVIIIVSLQIYYQNSLQQQKEDAKYMLLQREDKNIRNDLMLQMLHTLLLLQGQEDRLQRLLIESTQDILIWMDSKNKSDQDFIVMCGFWNNDEMRKAFADINNTNFEKIGTKLDGLCRSKDLIEYTK